MAKAAAAKGYGDEEDESALRHDREDDKMRGHDHAGNANQGRR